MDAIDRHARKQVLLTRIALQRAELHRDIARLQQAARVPNLLRAAIGVGAGRSLFGAASADGEGGWGRLALSLLRRYRVAAALLGGVAPILGRRGGWRRVVGFGAIAAAAWLGWRTMQGRSRQP